MRATVSTSGSSGMERAYPAEETCAPSDFISAKKTMGDELRNTRCVPLYMTRSEPNMNIKTLCRWLALSLTVFIAAHTQAWGAPVIPSVTPSVEVAETGWRTRSRDNICGLSNPRQVNHPARLDYKQVLRATPEMKDLVRRNINPRSAEGQILRQRAVDRVRRASSLVMHSHGHCSVWKRISHRDGRAVKNLTDEVIATLSAA